MIILTGLLLSAYLPYLNPGKYWITGFSGFFFPLLFPVSLLLIPVLWWLKYKKLWWLCGIAVLCCIPAALTTWGVHIFPNNNIAKHPNSQEFTLMTYNTSSMGLMAYKTDKDKAAAIYNVVLKNSPDILCMQEFYSNDKPDLEHHIDSLMQAGHYTYHYFTCDKTGWNTWHYGIALFSRFPIATAQAIPCGESKAGSGSTFLQADLVVQSDTIRVFSVQLTSYMFKGDDYENMKAPGSSGLIHKMRATFRKRASQAEQLAALIAKSPYPTIVCGDFNDTPVSYTYRTVSRNLQDVFLETGRGWGRTLSFLSPSLRIDYILAQRLFRIHGGQVLPTHPSEHFPVMACLSLKKY
ncbi:endonuclease/exonuclease/phosphatase family protein [Chitinophaga sp.]|uniref:endonuclease/exonuclease/phosphatase family protein n=1 Tax=Chitinophaga sp. TaxID=1869181 RepID=UPI0025BC8C1F|nr:endonuclease/exonuclease/phosphatase family protein [Chitinophaga sp.]